MNPPHPQLTPLNRRRESRRNLLLILIGLLGSDVVEAELVNALGGRDDAQPVTELLLLEVLLGPVLIILAQPSQVLS